MYIERVNPNHVGIIWGQRKKQLNKGSHYIKLGKVYFQLIPIIYGLSVCAYLDAFTNYVYNIMLSIGLSGIITIIGISFILYVLPFKLGIENNSNITKSGDLKKC
jgi:hypothetical protein